VLEDVADAALGGGLVTRAAFQAEGDGDGAAAGQAGGDDAEAVGQDRALGVAPEAPGVVDGARLLGSGVRERGRMAGARKAKEGIGVVGKSLKV